LAGLNYIDANNWRYENYGTADLLSVSGTTLTNLPETQSKTGSAFYQTTRAKCFDIPATNEIWIKFDVYFNGSNRWRAYNTGSADSCGVCSYASNLSLGMWRNGNNVQDFSGVCKKNTLQTVLLHMKAGASDGIVEAWVDGDFIYRYTGNVNQGSDFADIYLQSDGSGTFFSNVIISNAQIALDEVVAELHPIYDIAIKPEIFISWIPTGQVYLKPQIYASYIPKPEKATADLFRIVTNSESISADSFRKVTKSENNPADLLRKLTYSDTFPADIKRKVYQHEITSGDTFRRVVQSNIAAADSFRQVKKTEIVTADTSRKMGITIATADTQRNIIVSTSATFDTCRKIGETNIFSADTYLRTARTDIARADSFREVIVTTVATADALRKIGVIESFSGDTSRTLGTTETSQADTFRQVTATEIAIADLNRALREVASYDTFRKVTQKEKAIASTVIRVPHIWNYFIKPTLRTTKLLADNQPSLVNTFKNYGITAVNITLSERTLSDNFIFQTAKPININDAVQGSLLNYHFNFLVEEITQTELIREVKGRYNQDDLLYTWFLLETPNYTFSNGQTLEVPGGHIEKSRDSDGNKTIIGVYPKAIEIISKVAAYFGLAADVHIDDFTPSNLQGDEKITYSDLLNSVFGWTSRVPQRQINLFIRGNTLHCIQRGKETSIFDISGLQHSRPTVNKKFNRVLCHNPNNNNNNNNDDDDNEGYKFNGNIHYSKSGIAPFQSSVYMFCSYNNGLLSQETVNTTTGMFANSEGEVVTLSNHSTTTYSYTSYGKESYISSKEQNTTVKEQNMNTLETNTTEQKIKTTYGYNNDFNTQSQEHEIYLFHECEQTTKTEYQSGSKEREITKEIRDTYHVPVGNGWYAQTVYLNGILQGANLSQGKPGNSVSPYTVKQMQNTFRHYVIIQKPTANNENDELSNIIDDSFPIRDADIKKELNNALRWLHRKVQETVTVDLISPVNNGIPTINHIVDFTERVKFDGNEYFLVSNNFSFTPRKLIQKLQLIRWY